MKRLFTLAAFAIVIGLALSTIVTVAKRAVSPQCENPGAWYRGFNETYFDNRLPKDTVIDYANHDDSILAVTTFEGGHYHIAFNINYAASAPVVHVFLFHEMCHVQSWDEDAEHGPQWKTCMKGLIAKGAITDQMVNNYE